jgi:hypothetical protein
MACVIVLVIAAMFAYTRGLVFRDGSVKVAGESASAAVDKAVVAAMSAVSEMAGLGKLVAAGARAETEIPVPVAPAVPNSRKHTTRTAPIALAGVPVNLFDLPPSAVVEPAVAAPTAAANRAVLQASIPEPIIDSRVYGPDDRGVAAPVAVYPHLPTALPEGVSTSQLARIQLVIAQDGLVEAVKLLPGTSPVSVTEAMLLSAAKAWRFSPAIKDGRTVRYRKTVFLSEK